jgi:hypothetical protein
MTRWTHLKPNEWNVELIWSDGYPERLSELLGCEAVVALDGGVGTLSELAVAWSAAQSEREAPLLVAIGERWRRLFEARWNRSIRFAGGVVATSIRCRWLGRLGVPEFSQVVLPRIGRPTIRAMDRASAPVRRVRHGRPGLHAAGASASLTTASFGLAAGARPAEASCWMAALLGMNTAGRRKR